MPTYNGKYQKEYDLKKDHAEIKKEIKGWELKIDEMLKNYGENLNDMYMDDGNSISAELDQMSQNMMAINI